MNFKKWLLASLVVWVLCFIFDWIIHGGILMDYYEATAEHWRPESEMGARMWAMILGQLLFALLFCAIYTKGLREGGLAEGIRYGIWIGLLFNLPVYFIRWSVEPLPGAYLFLSSLFGFIEVIILGGILGIIYGKVAKT
ncbi:MAG: hypothetical protein FJY66_02165 [Calditrichaeota bacterium]|nr:hypothetical protein [Calditrichota bacterium]